MSLEKQISLVEESGMLGESIPGLELDLILENLAQKSDELKSQYDAIEAQIEENVSRGMPREQARAEAESQIESIKKTAKERLKQPVVEQITIIKQQYKVVKEGLKSIPEDVTAVAANILLPPAISVPPAAPNPLYAINLAATSKNALSSTLSTMIIAFTEMVKAANIIQFVLPVPILSLYESIKELSSLIDSIPL